MPARGQELVNDMDAGPCHHGVQRNKASGHLPLSIMKVCNSEVWGDEEEMEERPLGRNI